MTALARPLAVPDTLRRRATASVNACIARALDSASEETLAAIVGAQVEFSKLDHQLDDSAACTQMLSKSDAFLGASFGG